MAHTSDNPISASTMSGLTMMFTEAEELFAATVKMFPSYLLFTSPCAILGRSESPAEFSPFYVLFGS